MERKNFLLSLLGFPVAAKSILNSKPKEPAKKLVKVKKIRIVSQPRQSGFLAKRGTLPSAGGDRFEEYEDWEYQ